MQDSEPKLERANSTAMTLEIGLVLGILVGAVALFISEKFPIDLVAFLVLASLLVLKLVTPEQGVSGFSNQATVTVAAMFILSAGIQKTGAIAALGRLLLRQAKNRVLALALIMASVGLLSAFINNTAAVAVFIPLVLTIAARRKIAPSRLLIPLSFASQFGGVCTLIGTSTNLLVSAISAQAGYGAFSMFEFSRLGFIYFVVGALYFVLFGRWLLPDRKSKDLTEAFQLGEYITEMRVAAESPLIGKTVRQSKLGSDHDVTVVRLLHHHKKVWSPLRQHLDKGDVLLVRGKVKDLMDMKASTGLVLNAEFKLRDAEFESDDQMLIQALVAPRARIIGHDLKELDFRNRYNALVLAIQRRGESIREKLNSVSLELGDALLIQAPKEEVARLREDDDFIVLGALDEPSLRRRKVPIVLAIIAIVVGLAAFNFMPILVAAIAGTIVMVLTRCIDLEEAYESIDWKVIFLLAGIFPLGIAMQETGAARLIAEGTIGLVGNMGPIAVLAMLYLVTSILTATMSNNATAVLLAPIAIATAQNLNVDPKPFLMCVTFAASTSFATPIGYQTNTMIYNPGGYRYTDFFRAGIPLNIIFWILAVILIPMFWSF